MRTGVAAAIAAVLMALPACSEHSTPGPKLPARFLSLSRTDQLGLEQACQDSYNANSAAAVEGFAVLDDPYLKGLADHAQKLDWSYILDVCKSYGWQPFTYKPAHG